MTIDELKVTLKMLDIKYNESLTSDMTIISHAYNNDPEIKNTIIKILDNYNFKWSIYEFSKKNQVIYIDDKEQN
jgi:hypothetical protein